jgi:hypothetical protein
MLAASCQTSAMSFGSGETGDAPGKGQNDLGLLTDPTERAALHLLCRLPNKLFMLVNPLGPLNHRAGRRAGVALLGIDLLQAWLLRHGELDGRWSHRLRIAMDILSSTVVVGMSRFDTACGCQALFDVAPVVMETAYRRGPRTAIRTVAPIALTIGATRIAKGRRPGAGDLAAWSALPVLGGMVWAKAERSQVRRRSEREAIRRRAAGEQRFLDGRRAWISSHLRLLDRLEHFGMRIADIPGVELASAQELDQLAKDARNVEPPAPGRAAFLAALLHQYESEQRLTHHIEDRLALGDVPLEHARRLLTATQTRRLWDALTLMGVAGDLTVTVTDEVHRGLDIDLTVHINCSRTLHNGPPAQLTLKLPAGTPSWRLEFVTLGLLLASTYELLVCMAPPAGVAVSWGVGGACTAASAAAALAAERQVRRKGSDAAPDAALLGLGPALLMAAWGPRRLGMPHNDAGISVFPGLWALNGIGYLLGYYAPRMTPARKAQLAAGLAVHLATTWFGGHHPRSASIFLLDLLNWTATTIIAGAWLASALDKLRNCITIESDKQTAEHAAQQWLAGWGYQHREAELMNDLARHTMERARPETSRHQQKLRKARQEFNRLVDDVRRAARPDLDQTTER